MIDWNVEKHTACIECLPGRLPACTSLAREGEASSILKAITAENNLAETPLFVPL